MKIGEMRYYKPKKYRYFTDADFSIDEEMTANNVFVYLGWITCNDGYKQYRQGQYYCPMGQHGHFGETDGSEVLKDCKEISLETYLKVSNGIYTPEEYIEKR